MLRELPENTVKQFNDTSKKSTKRKWVQQSDKKY